MNSVYKPGFILLLLTLLLSSRTTNAHPWGGLVIDSDGNIYFTFICPLVDDDHFACVWKIDSDLGLSETLKSERSPSDIILSRNSVRTIYAAERSGNAPNYSNRFWILGSNGERESLINTRNQSLFHIQAYAVHENGDLYFARNDSIFVRNKESQIIALPISIPNGERIGLLEFSPSGELYILAGDELHVFHENKLSLIAQEIRDKNPENIPFRGANILFDMVIDQDGSAYLAYYGNRKVIRINKEGSISTIMESEGPWSPHGIDIFNGELYVLESTLGDGTWWKFWQDSRIIPRVRKLGSDGVITTIFEYSTD